MQNYQLIGKKGQGAFSEVLKAQSLKTEKLVAIKCMKNHFSSIEQVNRFREIQALRKLSPHQHIIKLYECLYDEPTGRLALVFELMDCNLYEHIKGRKQYLNPQKLKYYMFQLLQSIEHMHRNGIFHRDIKPENILMQGDHIKLADFGSCKGIYSKHPYTEYISTRWYRAPECLLTDGYYDYQMDIWGMGCVMFEVVSLYPLFPGNNELDQINKIHNILGTPHPKVIQRFKKHATHMQLNFPFQQGTSLEKLLPNSPKDLVDLIKQLLIYDPQQRITSQEALRHEYFRELVELEQQKLLQSSLMSIKLHTKQNSQVIHADNESLQNSMQKAGYDSNNEKKYQMAAANYNGSLKQSNGSSMNGNLAKPKQFEGVLKENSQELDNDQMMFPPIAKNPDLKMTMKKPKQNYDPLKVYMQQDHSNHVLQKPAKINPHASGSGGEELVIWSKKAVLNNHNNQYQGPLNSNRIEKVN